MAHISRRRQAESDLLDLWDYIEQANGEACANTYIHQIERALETLAEQPGIGRSRDDLGEGLYSLPVASHVIFYRLMKGGIEVVRVLHGKRDIDAIFADEADDQDELS